MISSCEHHSRHANCMRQFLIYSGRDFDSSSLSALRKLDAEASEKGICPLVELHRRITQRETYVEKRAFECINSSEPTTTCPIHGIEGETHCSCLEIFIDEKGHSLTAAQIIQIRRWMRTKADPRSCALSQLCQSQADEMKLFLDGDEDLCQCDCDRKPRKREKKERKKRKKEKKPREPLLVKKAGKKKFMRASTEIQRASRSFEAKPLLEEAVDVVLPNPDTSPDVATLKEGEIPKTFEASAIKPPEIGCGTWKTSSIKMRYASSLTAPRHTDATGKVFSNFAVANKADRTDSVVMLPSPHVEYALTHSSSQQTLIMSNIINDAAPEDDAQYADTAPEEDAQYADATSTTALEHPAEGERGEGRNVRAEERKEEEWADEKEEEVEEADADRITQTIVSADTSQRFAEERKMDSIIGEEPDEVIGDIADSVIMPAAPTSEATHPPTTLNHPDAIQDCSGCGRECVCEPGNNILLYRMEKILKKFIVSLRNRDKKDFKKYYKTVMQNLDATFQTKTFCQLTLAEVVFLLSCDDLSVETEDHVFDWLLHWISIDIPQRRTHIFDLMKCIRLIYVKKSQIVRMLENVLVSQDLTTRRHALLQGALVFKEYSRENQINYVKVFKDYFMIPKRRGKKDPVSIVETMKTLLDGKLCECIPDAKSKFPLTVNMTHPFLFLTPDGCTVSSQAHFDATTKSGKDHCVSFPDLNIKEDVITIIGGVCPDYPYGREAGFHVFCLNPCSLTWDCLTRLPAPRDHHGVAQVNGILYVIGGNDVIKAKTRGNGNGVSKDVFAYDPVNDTWWACPPLSTPRSHHSVKVVFGLIYVCGGLDDQDSVLSVP